jgi:hypothetical protein
VRERRYAGPEETIEPGLLHEPEEATDADGLTAEETLAEGVERTDGDQPQATAEEGAASSEEAQGGAAGDVQAGTVDETESEIADAPPAEADADGSSSDVGDAEAGATAGDAPA